MSQPLTRIPTGPDAPTAEPVASVTQSRTATFLRALARAVERDAATSHPPTFAGGRSDASSGIPRLPLTGHPPAPLAPVGAAAPPAGSQEVRSLVAEAARREGVPPALLAALVDQESGFDPRAVSPAGAKGLTQLMDGTAQGLGVTDPFDPWQNLLGGARFLRAQLDRYHGDVSLALAAYNAGPGAVDRYGGIPPYAETQTYVRRVSSLYHQFASQYGGAG